VGQALALAVQGAVAVVPFAAMMPAPVDESAVASALLGLLAQGACTFDVLESVARALSARGLSRREIVTLFWRLMANHGQAMTEAQLDLVGDVNSHLAGQCAVSGIIRLQDDPGDPEALALKVQRDMAGWVAPA
jgi:hypothetical protein